ncbi:hypothetical protein ACFX2G_047794 [Malus domestica]
MMRKQLIVLKPKSKEEGSTINYSTYEMLAGSNVRNLLYHKRTINYVHITVDGRSIMQPPLPLGFLGIVIFASAPFATAEDLKSKPTSYAANRIHDVVVRMKRTITLGQLLTILTITLG